MRYFVFLKKSPRVRGFWLSIGRPLSTAFLALAISSSAFDTASARQYRHRYYRQQSVERESEPKSDSRSRLALCSRLSRSPNSM